MTRARRVKCDEEKPTCLRCARSGRICEGYPERAPSNSLVLSTQSTPGTGSSVQTPFSMKIYLTLADGIPQSEDQNRLAQLGVALLSSDAYVCFGTSGSIFERLLPHLNHCIPSVNAAAVVLGSIYQLQASSDHTAGQDHRGNAFVASQYLSALRILKNELQARSFGTVPLVLCCLLLAVAEVLLKQENNALAHLRGAYQLLTERRRSHPLAWEPIDEDRTPETPTIPEEDNLELLFRGLDIQTAAYAVGFQPELPSVPVPTVNLNIVNLPNARSYLLHLLHASFTWSSSLCPVRYLPHAVDAATLVEQGRHISNLSCWLDNFNRSVMPNIPSDRGGGLRSGLVLAHALTLRSICVACLIWISALLEPRESFLDSFGPRFEQIIQDAEIVISQRIHHHNSRDQHLPLRQGENTAIFSPGPGILYPLFLTARKYRHPLGRRKAISLLRQGGMEGPWCGPREAVVATRMMQYEEAWPEKPASVPSPLSRTDLVYTELGPYPHNLHTFSPNAIPESARVLVSLRTRDIETDQNRIVVSFRRCPNLPDALACLSTRRPPYDKNGTIICEDGHWEVWEEQLDF